MAPSVLSSSYKRYTADLNSFAAWLASYAQANGFPDDLWEASIPATSQSIKSNVQSASDAAQQDHNAKHTGEEAGPSQHASPQRKVNTATLMAMALWLDQSCPETLEITEEVSYLLCRSMVHRAFHHTSDNLGKHSDLTARPTQGIYEAMGTIWSILGQYRSGRAHTSAHEQDASSRADVLSKLRDVLLDYSSTSTPQIETSTAVDESGYYVPTFVGTPVSSDLSQMYQVRPQDSEEELRLAVHNLFSDLGQVRKRLHTTWNSYKAGTDNLVTASLVTNTAIAFAEVLLREFNDLFNSCPDNITMATALSIFIDSDDCFYTAWRILTAFADEIRPGNVPVVIPLQLALLDPASSPATPQEAFDRDATIMFSVLADLCAITDLPWPAAAEDELSRLVRQLRRTKQATVLLTFAVQVFLDIHDILGKDIGRGLIEVQQNAQRTKIMIRLVLDFHKNMHHPNWPEHNNEALKDLVRRIDSWTLGDMVQTYREQLRRRFSSAPPINEAFFMMKHHPWYCGLQLYSIRASAQESAITLADCYDGVLYCAHMYNAIQREASNPPFWPDMNVALFMHGLEHVLSGAPPKTVLDYARRLLIAKGYPASSIDAGSRLEPGALPTKPSTFLGKVAPIHGMFMGRLVHQKFDNDITPEQIADALRKHTDLLCNDDKRAKTKAKGCPRKRKVYHGQSDMKSVFTCSNTGIEAQDLLHALAVALRAEDVEFWFDHFRLHMSCMTLLRRMCTQFDDRFRSSFGDNYLPNEAYLAQVVNYAFSYIIGQREEIEDTLPGGILGTAPVVKHVMFFEIAETMSKWLTTGKGAAGVSSLERDHKIKIDIPDVMLADGQASTSGSLVGILI